MFLIVYHLDQDAAKPNRPGARSRTLVLTGYIRYIYIIEWKPDTTTRQPTQTGADTIVITQHHYTHGSIPFEFSESPASPCTHHGFCTLPP